MAVNWTWKEKLGTIHCERVIKGGEEKITFDLQIYKGTNCWCVVVNEFKENGKELYNFWTFFNDIAHAKRCLGISKSWDGKKENIFKDEWKKVTLNGNFKDAWKLAEIFFNAGLKIKINNKEGE